uniref:Uncharacterized protein n=1 Tax=Hyaloperonospora arabidopsidis (strain Emoy2) TaxID=559515 RepID=M4BKM3_HYAAE
MASCSRQKATSRTRHATRRTAFSRALPRKPSIWVKSPTVTTTATWSRTTLSAYLLCAWRRADGRWSLLSSKPVATNGRSLCPSRVQ